MRTGGANLAGGCITRGRGMAHSNVSAYETIVKQIRKLIVTSRRLTEFQRGEFRADRFADSARDDGGRLLREKRSQ